MNLKEDIHAQNVQLKIANKDLRVKLELMTQEKYQEAEDARILRDRIENFMLEKVNEEMKVVEYKMKMYVLLFLLVVSIFFNLFAYYLLTR